MGNQAKEAHTAEDYNELSSCLLCKKKDSQLNWTHIGVQSVFPMELMAIVAALQLADPIQITANEIVTDSLACCQIANRR